MVCGRFQHPRRPRRGRREKGGSQQALGRSHGGWGSKLHLLTDGAGLPLAVMLSAGQRHESLYLEPLVELAMAHGRRPEYLLGDKGYSAPRIRRWLSQHGIQPVIPHRADEHRVHPNLPLLDKTRYRQRNVVERAVGWIKQFRSVATRFDKLARCYLAMLRLAFIRIALRRADSSDTA